MTSEFDMQDKVALVTGASSGFGIHFAKVLADRGAKVVLAARRTDRLQALVSEIEHSGGQASAVALDVTKGESIVSAFEYAESVFGTVTVVSNNAGIADAKSSLKTSEVSWDKVLDTNLKGAWMVANKAAERMLAAGLGGSIVNTASILGIRASFAQTSYCASKAGVIHMTKVLALEWAQKGIRVNALCPGYFLTEMTEGYIKTPAGEAFISSSVPGRLGDINELTAPFLLLASDAGAFVNGVALPVDGAMSVGNL